METYHWGVKDEIFYGLITLEQKKWHFYEVVHMMAVVYDYDSSPVSISAKMII